MNAPLKKIIISLMVFSAMAIGIGTGIIFLKSIKSSLSLIWWQREILFGFAGLFLFFYSFRKVVYLMSGFLYKEHSLSSTTSLFLLCALFGFAFHLLLTSVFSFLIRTLLVPD